MRRVGEISSGQIIELEHGSISRPARIDLEESSLFRLQCYIFAVSLG